MLDKLIIKKEAAKRYDKLILMHQGLSAKTNYNYTVNKVKEIMKILFEARL